MNKNKDTLTSKPEAAWNASESKTSVLKMRQKQIAQESQQNAALFELKMDVQRAELQKIQIQIDSLRRAEERNEEIHKLNLHFLKSQK